MGGAYFHDALVQSDVVVTGMHGSYNDHLSTHAVAFLLAFARRFDHYLPQKRWQRGPGMIDLPSRTVLIVGVGALSLLASVWCRKTRDAVLCTYFALVAGSLLLRALTAAGWDFPAEALSPWQVTAIGRAEVWALHARAAELGGHLRTGLEDTFYLPDGRRALSNGELVDALARCARAAGREIASPAEARTLMGLRP